MTRLLLAALAVFVLGLGTAALYVSNQAREDIARQSLENCREIEQIKTGARSAAWRDFNDLNRNLKLLGIARSPEVVDAAKRSRDRRLEQYKAEKCPRVLAGEK